VHGVPEDVLAGVTITRFERGIDFQETASLSRNRERNRTRVEYVLLPGKLSGVDMLKLDCMKGMIHLLATVRAAV
jgi:hypothetical protein